MSAIFETREFFDLIKKGIISKPANLVSLCGERRVGKDYLAQALVERHGAKRLSFSDEVRDLAQTVFSWFDAYMPDEQKDKTYEAPENFHRVTGRDILLHAGRARDIDPEYFVRRFVANQLKSVYENPDVLHIITDFRTPDEYNSFLKPMGVPIIKIVRMGGPPTSEFEMYIKEFPHYDWVYKNAHIGPDEFLSRFKVFAGDKSLKGVK